MLRLIGLVVSIGLADSLNPTTIGVTGLASHTPFWRFVRSRLFLRHLG